MKPRTVLVALIVILLAAAAPGSAQAQTKKDSASAWGEAVDLKPLMPPPVKPFLPPNSLFTPAQYRADVRISKIIPVNERIKAAFNFEVFNVSNTPPLNDPNGSFGSAAFGTITSAGNPRDFEFAAKVRF